MSVEILSDLMPQVCPTRNHKLSGSSHKTTVDKCIAQPHDTDLYIGT